MRMSVGGQITVLPGAGITEVSPGCSAAAGEGKVKASRRKILKTALVDALGQTDIEAIPVLYLNCVTMPTA